MNLYMHACLCVNLRVSEGDQWVCACACLWVSVYVCERARVSLGVSRGRTLFCVGESVTNWVRGCVRMCTWVDFCSPCEWVLYASSCARLKIRSGVLANSTWLPYGSQQLFSHSFSWVEGAIAKYSTEPWTDKSVGTQLPINCSTHED